MAAAWAEQEESDRRQRDDRARFAAEAIEAEYLSTRTEGAKSGFFDPLLRRPSVSTIDSDSTVSLKKSPSQSKPSRVVSGVNKLKKFMMVTPTIPVVADGEKPPLPERMVDVPTPLQTPGQLETSFSRCTSWFFLTLCTQ